MGRCPLRPILLLLVLLQTFTFVVSFNIRVPQTSATIFVPITVTWSLSNGDPTSFGLMEKDVDDGTIGSVVAVNAGSSSVGNAELTFVKAGINTVSGSMLFKGFCNCLLRQAKLLSQPVVHLKSGWLKIRV
ncbi:uncharacterized protein C8R40DRAFT_1074464 [Lentinula edodes]|uniref:uncharacterized protein n=1 Tax=Lentinula edodes TaxID=5353 RepID=UPI001E8DBD9B|nr:uncharacterized protein C8R40DRAFT_1074464 [Lentinula edodes]KAH7868841.1 hypothetical protein C8R40DRAFT_1074464 [Lentinula edodes]